MYCPRRASVHVARRWGTAPPYTTCHAGGESCVFRVAQAKKLHRCYKLGNGKSVQMISERSWEFIRDLGRMRETDEHGGELNGT